MSQTETRERPRQQNRLTCTAINDVVAGEVQLLFDEAQEPVLGRIDRNVAELERQGIKLPRIDGLPVRRRRAGTIGDAIADIVREAREAKAAEKGTLY